MWRTTNLTEWIDESHFLNLFPVGHPEHPSKFEDSIYHTCVYLIGLDLEGLLTPFWLNHFSLGIDLRWNGKKLIRSPFVDKPMSRDQLQFLPYCLQLIGRQDLAKKFIRKYGHEVIFLERYVPHWYMHYKRSLKIEKSNCLRKFCDRFEYADMYFDKPKTVTKTLEDGSKIKVKEISESSIHKNIVRLCIMKDRYPSSIHDDLIEYFNRYFNAWEIFKTYHTRYWVDQPPIHHVYKKIIERTFGISTDEKKSLGTIPAEGFAFNPVFQFPVNEKCFCGSGIKFKKCCKNNMPQIITIEEAEKIDAALREVGLK